MDYIDQSNLAKGSRWSDRLTYDGMWENNLYTFMRLVMPKLVAELKRPFRLDGIVRVDDTSVHKALREAVVNMMIHSDYLVTGVLKIVKTDDGFMFSNPGSLKLPVEAIYEGGHSVARNPRIQTMFRMIGLGDNIGSGFPAILKVWGDENWRQPDLSENEALHQVDLKLWMISLMPQECTDHLKQLLGQVYSLMGKNEQIILGTAYLEGTVTNARLQSLLHMHSTDVGQLLSDLVNQEMLIPENKGRWKRYHLNEHYKQKSEQLNLSDIRRESPKFNNDTDRKIYEYICENQFITSEQVLNITHIKTHSGATMALRRLVKADIIEQHHRGRQYYYTLKQ